jgi:hypothetical protein
MGEEAAMNFKDTATAQQEQDERVAVYDGLRLKVRRSSNWGSAYQGQSNPTLYFSLEKQDLNEVVAVLSKEGGIIRYNKESWRVTSICNIDIRLWNRDPVAEWGFWARELDEMESLREQFREWETA